MKIIVIGTGWYGCYISTILKNKHEVILIDKNTDIFENSSYYNQNRVHLGYHYPRSFKTRQLCKNTYDKFLKEFSHLINKIPKNYYTISKNSLIDYDTYKNLYTYENYSFNIHQNTDFDNIDGNLIEVDELVIDSLKAKNYFKEKLQDTKYIFNTTVNKYSRNNNKITVHTDKGDYQCDFLLDCTYNQLGLCKNNKYIYELDIMFEFKKINFVNFNGITIMDGNFMSLYPRDIDNDIFTLSDVEHTPVLVSDNYNDIHNYLITNEKIDELFLKFTEKISFYYPEFKNNFTYHSYFLTKKTKIINNSASRHIIIEQVDENVVSVNCGKICGIFEFEEYLKNKILI
uniref:FAD dependent oxidoreductase domain-containing protein n=1 Tax=viral metagenome TaxID=1070528 RepID=A0A6C0I8Y6_9ZZZZ